MITYLINGLRFPVARWLYRWRGPVWWQWDSEHPQARVPAPQWAGTRWLFVDAEMVPLLRACWAWDLVTLYSCQEFDPGRAQIVFDTDDAARDFAMVAMGSHEPDGWEFTPMAPAYGDPDVPSVGVLFDRELLFRTTLRGPDGERFGPSTAEGEV